MSKDYIIVSKYRIRQENIDEFLIMSPYGKTIKINSIGKFILDLCNGENTINQIVNKITDIYDIDSTIVLNDVYNFINKLKLCGLIN